MRLKSVFYPASICIIFFSFSSLFQACSYNSKSPKRKKNALLLREGERNEGGRKRMEYEFKLLRDPRTGKIPADIRKKEMELLKTLPSKSDPAYRDMVNNTYTAVGPTQNGGRTRALAFDSRYNGSTNKVILAGGVNGGIFRSTDGGATWAFVSPENEIHSVSCFAQDPITKDTWYAGTGGEVSGASAADISSYLVPGFGIYKSINNGATWTRLTSTTSGSQTPSNPNSLIDNVFDMVYRIVVHPTTGDVYAAVQNTIMRSSNGGTSWSAVLVPTTNSAVDGGMTDLAINASGTRIYAAFSGRNADRNFAGVFTSTTGNSGAWTRIAGGISNAADSVAGWRGYDNTQDPNSPSYYAGGWGRIVLATAPSNNNLLYVMYYNNVDVTTGSPDADLFRADVTSYPTISWSNRSANLVADYIDPGTGNIYSDPFDSQIEYNMCLTVHPTNANLVIAGGVELYRSTDGFSSMGNVTLIGGYQSGSFLDPNYASHPDFHAIAFDPSNVNRMVVGADGGLAATSNVTASAVTWGLFNSQYQTFQYYHVAIDPTVASQMYAGGAQDNSTSLRDPNNLLGIPVSDPNDHIITLGGDGGSVGITKKGALNKQYLFGSSQYGNISRLPLVADSADVNIKPSGSGDGQFVTYFHLDEDNTDNLYYASDDALYRTRNSTTVTSAGWEEMTGVQTKLAGRKIFALATSRGTYSSNSYLFIGTDNNQIYRLKDPANSLLNTQPTIITPTGTITSGSVITDIAVNPRSADTVMFVCSNYGVKSIFWTGNATAATPTWQSIEGNISLPSVRTCAIVAKTTGVEYYVGTSIGLYSTTTINSTSTVWANEGSGAIKTAIVNDLAYRWQDNTLLVGTHGNGMFMANIGNAVTGVNDPIRNDKNFIKTSFPTAANNQLWYQTGNLTGIRKMEVEVIGINGQVIFKQQVPFRDGSIPVNKLANGTYILNITSDNKKYVYTNRFVKIN